MSNFFNPFLGDFNLNRNKKQYNENYTKLCQDIVSEILNDENNITSFVKKLKNIQNNKKDIFIKNFNHIILDNMILNEADINNINTDLFPLISLLSAITTKTINDRINFLLFENKKFQTQSFMNILPAIGNIFFEFNIQLFLCELDKLPDTKKEKILNIFYDIMGNELPNRSEKNNDSIKTNNNTESKEDIKTDNSENIIKEEIINYIPKCKDKLKEIKELSKDFEYAIKNDYYKECDDIENRLNSGINNKNELNKIIDEINNLYRNAYYKKHNKSSLSYVMDIEEEDLDLLEHI